MNYQEIKNQQAPTIDCFFAFSNKQFDEGVKEKNLEGQKILSAGNGLYGTREGIINFLGFYDNLNKRIGENCDPQEIYDYEFANHECGYVGDDLEAVKLLLNYFKPDQLVNVQRIYAVYSITDILNKA